MPREIYSIWLDEKDLSETPWRAQMIDYIAYFHSEDQAKRYVDSVKAYQREAKQVSEFGVSTLPVAQKDYRCAWCGEKINKGERHYKYAGMWEGDFQNWRMHLECQASAEDNDELQEGFSPFENPRPDPLVLVSA